MNKLYFLLSLMAFFSCTSNSTQIGSEFFTDGMLDVSYIDSSSVKLSTMQFASLITNNTGRIVAGSHADEYTGRITATPFFTLSNGKDISLEDLNTEYAYTALILHYDGYSYYDTTSVFKIRVHKLTQDIDLSSDYTLGNTDEFAYETQALGQISLAVRPHKQDSLAILLDDDFGKELYEKAVAGNSDLAAGADFTDYLKGIAIVPDTTSSGPLVGFSTSSELRVYYYDKSVVPSDLSYFSFSLSDSYYTTHYELPSNGPFSNIDEGEHLNSSSSNDLAVIQSGTGLALRVEIPYLRALKTLDNFYITSAVLDILPKENSYDEFSPLAESLSAYKVNGKNAVESETAYAANLYTDYLEREVRYSVDVTSFVQAQMETAEFNNNALLFIMDADTYRAGGNRICFTDKVSGYKTRLRIYYATINQ